MDGIIEFRRFHEILYSRQDEKINYTKKGFRPAKVRAYLIHNILRNFKNGNIADIGCGEGFFLTSLSSKFEKLIGIDFSLPSLKKLKQIIDDKKYGNIDIILADAHAVPIRDKVFDFALCMETLEHIYDPRRGLMELRRISKDKILITVPCYSNETRRKTTDRLGISITEYLKSIYKVTKTTHIHSFSESSLLNMVDVAGLKIEEMIRFGFVSFAFHLLDKAISLNINPKIEYVLTKLDIMLGKIPIYRSSLLSWGNTDCLILLKV